MSRRVVPRAVRTATIVACLFAISVPRVDAQSLLLREYQLKAAFLYNFVKFTDWPTDILPETSETLTLCVLSDDPSSEALESINGKAAKGRRLAIRRIESLKDVGSCHVLFISSAEEKRMPQVMQSVAGASVLTVGEMEEFAQSGGIINFVVEKNKIRFEINVNSAERARLKLSSQLLSLARVVRQ